MRWPSLVNRRSSSSASAPSDSAALKRLISSISAAQAAISYTSKSIFSSKFASQQLSQSTQAGSAMEAADLKLMIVFSGYSLLYPRCAITIGLLTSSKIALPRPQWTGSESLMRGPSLHPASRISIFFHLQLKRPGPTQSCRYSTCRSEMANLRILPNCNRSTAPPSQER
jgi:hypothetical protein